MNSENHDNKFKGLLGDYIITPTDDGSTTLFSEYFNEGCHSTAGAKAETLYNYFEGTKVADNYQQNKAAIFEVGFGLGIGYQVTTENLDPTEGELLYISAELDEGLLDYAAKNITIPEGFPQLNQLLKKQSGDLIWYESTQGKHRLMVLIGDMRESLVYFHKQFPSIKVNSIYQDAFSPKRNPTLWTWQWFEQLKLISLPEALMSTYSSSNSIRKAMIKAGWKLQNAKGFGPKKLSTRAALKGETEADILEKLERSPAAALSDQNT